MSRIRDLSVPLAIQKQLQQLEEESSLTFAQLLLGYFCTDSLESDKAKERFLRLWKRSPKTLETYRNYLEAIWNDLRFFPVPLSDKNPSYKVSYEDSWMNERTFGGKRGHEGCDLMASVNERGIYPILSMTDGVVEQKGWLPQGGYRIGIRAPGGAYFYYAHLASYAPALEVKDRIKAGELLG